MPLTIRPLHPTFAAEIHGVDFSKLLTDEVSKEIRDAISKDTGAPSLMGRPELTDQGNIDSNRNVISPSDPRAQISKGNMLFHVDSSFNSRRASYSILLAHEIPPSGGGGNTEFADTRAAWDELPECWKQGLMEKDYVAGHSFWHSRKKACPEFFAKLEPEKHPMSKHKVAQLHQASGRMNLFVPSHCHHIEGLQAEEGREKLEYLCRYAT
ncbi:TfdA family Taurine catabolism dioxygenase TauD [Colletotrichum graminicola M1.001]|uniref:TfdA family Taurine catabolism dioxygenase TauD n=1 Tax=Colletotrichum graminicola (strain M1.001 / M2 / FGSC 10212) TaxID=645133 RepID=E3QUI8_COLGM|nr:TfdA family Taurine catabolism dioxygenase TauD [Colletotrichum graminicola M1.001]EFQ34526.1 TfdA family Taurine catabolism dioxygenase TauD [Colletotrichum graminicola M1.001]